MNHYTYRMDRIVSPEHERFGEYYIGVRSCKCLPEDDTRYRGSGVVITAKRKGGAKYRKTILATFATREEANADEAERVQEEQVEDPLCLNKMGGGMNGLFGEEAREKMRQAAQKRAQDPEWRRNVLEANRNRSQDPEWRRNVLEANRNRSQDPEYRRGRREVGRKNAQDPEWWRKTREGCRKKAKLTEDVVREIRRRCAEGETQAEVARCFVVARSTVGDVVRRKIWSDID